MTAIATTPGGTCWRFKWCCKASFLFDEERTESLWLDFLIESGQKIDDSYDWLQDQEFWDFFGDSKDDQLELEEQLLQMDPYQYLLNAYRPNSCTALQYSAGSIQLSQKGGDLDNLLQAKTQIVSAKRHRADSRLFLTSSTDTPAVKRVKCAR
jgi:hypothetical protein